MVSFMIIWLTCRESIHYTYLKGDYMCSGRNLKSINNISVDGNPTWGIQFTASHFAGRTISDPMIQ